MDTFADNFLQWSVIERYFPDIVSGFRITVLLAVVIVASGVAMGSALAALRTVRIRPLNWAIVIFADVTRAVPPLALLFVCFFGLPYLGLRLSGFVVSWLVLSGVLAAFTEELLWAGMAAIPVGQWEAARSTGLSLPQTLGYVVLPQAFRLVLAPLTSRIIATIKNTSLASVVAVPELLSQANAAQGYSANASPLTAASIGYIIILLPIVVLSRRLETRKQRR